MGNHSVCGRAWLFCCQLRRRRTWTRLEPTIMLIFWLLYRIGPCAVPCRMPLVLQLLLRRTLTRVASAPHDTENIHPGASVICAEASVKESEISDVARVDSDEEGNPEQTSSSLDRAIVLRRNELARAKYNLTWQFPDTAACGNGVVCGQATSRKDPDTFAKMLGSLASKSAGCFAKTIPTCLGLSLSHVIRTSNITPCIDWSIGWKCCLGVDPRDAPILPWCVIKQDVETSEGVRSMYLVCAGLARFVNDYRGVVWALQYAIHTTYIHFQNFDTFIIEKIKRCWTKTQANCRVL